MDDPRTRQSIDELAEHYLTGVTAAPPVTDPLAGPAPIRLAPKPATSAPPPMQQAMQPQALRTGDSDGQEDGHPILRLADAQTQHDDEDLLAKPTAAAPPQPARAQAHAVVMGNLPGLSGPWLTQYAQRLAQQQGPVAILHVDDAMIDLEVVEPRIEAMPQPTAPVAATHVPAVPEGEGLVGLLDALVHSAHAPVQTVLVRLSAQPEAMSTSRLGALDRWTVLCGADDAAVVACYSMLKGLVEHEPRLAGKHVGLMVMGSDEDAAHRAVEKVASTADSFLKTPVQCVGHLRQMQPVTVKQMGSFPDPVALWPQLVAWLDRLDTATPAPDASTHGPAHTPRLEPIINHPLPTPQPRRAVAPTLRTTEPRRPEPDQAPPQATSAPRTAQPVAAITTNPATPDTPVDDLFALLAQGPAALDSGVALDARVPAAPAIQLAVDGQGTLHLLMHHGTADDPRRAMPEMLDARRWAAEHRELLALTQRDRAFADCPPVLHLFTDRAEQATALVARLGDSVRLHLLQKVTLGRETGWFCTPLN